MKKIFNVLVGVFCLVTIGQGQVVYYNNESVGCLPKVFHVSIHIVLDKEGEGNIRLERIEEQLETATAYFDPICWSYELCKVDTIQNYAFDTLNVDRYHKLQEHFNDDHMLNIYYVGIGHTVDFCHLSTVNGIQNPTTAHIVMAKFCSSVDLVHKLGHLFGLEDTWANGGELVDGSNCEFAGDGLCSTPADPFVANSSEPIVNLNCEFIYEEQDANGDWYNPMLGNVMSSYSNCRDGLTVEQYRLMVANFQALNYTPW